MSSLTTNQPSTMDALSAIHSLAASMSSASAATIASLANSIIPPPPAPPPTQVYTFQASSLATAVPATTITIYYTPNHTTLPLSGDFMRLPEPRDGVQKRGEEDVAGSSPGSGSSDSSVGVGVDADVADAGSRLDAYAKTPTTYESAGVAVGGKVGFVLGGLLVVGSLACLLL